MALAILVAVAVFYYVKNRGEASEITPIANQSKPSENNLTSIGSAPILMYHYIRNVTDPNDTLGANLSVSPSIFDKQMKFLTDNNYQSVSLSELRDGFAGKKVIDKNKKPIVLTFDDGYDDAYTQAFPILKKYNMIGVFYIISGQIGQSERMTASQIVELDKAGMSIGSHTKNHLDLASLNGANLNNQLDDSKKRLEQLLNHPVYDFCYPAGKFDDGVALKVEDAGYLTAVTTNNGIANNENNLFELPRVRMQNNTNLAQILNN